MTKARIMMAALDISGILTVGAEPYPPQQLVFYDDIGKEIYFYMLFGKRLKE